MDGVSLLPTIRDPRKRPEAASSRSRRWRRCSRATSRSTRGTGPTRACAPTATPTSSTRRPASRSSTTGARTRTSCSNVAADPAYAQDRGEAGRASWRSWTAARAARATSSREGRRAPGRSRGRGAPAAAPAPARATLAGLHDARYCEIIELEGRAARTPRATVWNTIGLNTLPGRAGGTPSTPARWRRSSAPRVVVLNGPRHFLMDSVTATPGRVRSFHGQRLRRVATIPIRTRRRPGPDALHRPRRSSATTPGAGSAGAVVYELVAPGRRRLRDAGLRADRRPEA